MTPSTRAPHRADYAMGLVLLWLGVATVSADVIVTTNGSRLVGTLERMTPESAVIVTAFAGKITVPANMVANIITDQVVAVRFDSGDQLIGTLGEPSPGEMVMRSDIGEIPVPREKLSDVWPQGADTPEIISLKVEQAKKLAAVTPKWTAVIEGGGSRTEGNTDTLDGRGRLDIKRQTDLDNLMFHLYGQYSENNDARTKNEYGGGVRFEAKIRNDLYWYARLELEHDEFEDLDLRTTAAAGLTRYWLDKPEHEFKTSLGLGFRHETYEDDRTLDDALIDFGLDYRVDVRPWVQFVQAVSYTPVWDDFGDFRLHSDSALVFPFENENLKLKSGVRYEYNSMPIAGLDRLDTTYYTNIVLNLVQ